MRIGGSNCLSGQTYHNQLSSIQWWLNKPQGERAWVIANHFWWIDSLMTTTFNTYGPVTFERFQASQLLLESRDAAVRACLDMLAEQQKQELRAVSQS
jgi:hypothetical protein